VERFSAGGVAGRVGGCDSVGIDNSDGCSSPVEDRMLREERRANNSGMDTEDRHGWESMNSAMAWCTSESGTRARAVLVSEVVSEAEGLAARGSVPGKLGVLEAKMVDEVAAVEVEGAVAALEAIERLMGSSLSSAAMSNWVDGVCLLMYLPRESLRRFDVGPDIEWAAQGNRRQERLRLI
jgi:hypothetical protein